MGAPEKPTKVITGLVRFSYVNVFAPKAVKPGDPLKYSVKILIPKSDKHTVNAVKAAIENAKQAGLTEKFGGKIPANFKSPLRDGDTDNDSEDPTLFGHYYINANANEDHPPGVVGKDRMPILNKTDFYSGCYGHASITFFPFNTNGSKGVACGLNNVMKTKDGENLGGSSASAEQDFADIDIDDML